MTFQLSLAIFLLLLIIFLLAYRQWVLNKRAEKLAVCQNVRVDQLVADKELLVREIQHRVNNNLHIIISLLESQSEYVDSTAFAAIETSKNRIYAMSLVHQMLYQSEDKKWLNIANYLPELIAFLSDIFDQHAKVRFKLDIHPLLFDVIQAIPLVLILNEMISNALKHAFLGKTSGVVTIVMHETDAGSCELILEDDGIGLPFGLDIDQIGSLGLTLIRGLSRQLGAELTIIDENGTRFTLKNITCRS